jgi:outer membrane protein W
MRTSKLLLVVAVLAAMAAPALAEGGIVRGGVSYVLPGGDAKFDLSQGNASLEVDASFGLWIGYEFMFNDMFGIDTSIAWQDHDYTAYVPGKGKIDGSVGNIPLEFAFNFHVVRADWGSFFVGPVVGYNFAQDRADNALGWGVGLGADVNLNKEGLSLYLATSYMWVSQDWDLIGNSVEYDLDPWTFRFGVGYKF